MATSWQKPPSAPVLADYEVHVWRVPLDVPAPQLQRYAADLALEELRRAERFHFQQDRERFIVGRGALRSILGEYLGRSPSGLSFVYNPYGKPSLSPPDLRFNLSHTKALALIAVTHALEVGIDLEGIRPEFAEEQIAERFFSAREVAALRSLPAAAQSAAFFSCWTRKEAYIKARGEGLSLPLDAFTVSFLPGEKAAILSDITDPDAARRWSIHSLDPGEGCVAALVVEGHDRELRCWDWAGTP